MFARMAVPASNFYAYSRRSGSDFNYLSAACGVSKTGAAQLCIYRQPGRLRSCCARWDLPRGFSVVRSKANMHHLNLHVHAVVSQSRLCPPLTLEIYVEK